jgi:hypothetical protein
MALVRNTWKFLPPYTVPITSQSRVDGLLNGIFSLFDTSSYADGTARVTGSGVAWSFYRTSSVDSGSVLGPTAVVYGYPPTMSVMSQSVIFAGSASAPTISLPAMTTNASFVANALYMRVQHQANWSQYRSWLSGSIFNSGSSGVNTGSLARTGSGFAPIIGASVYSIGTINAWECGEAVAIACHTTSSTATATALSFGGIAGAFIDPESTDTTVDAEVDGRIYAVATSGVVIGLTFLSLTTDFLNHNATAGSSKFVFIQPTTDNKIILNLLETRTITYLTTSNRGSLISFPLYVKDATNRFIGRLREIEAIRNSVSGYVLRTSSSDLGYALGSSNAAAANAVMLNAI